MSASTTMPPPSVEEAERLVESRRYEEAASRYAALDAGRRLDARSLGNYGGVLSHLRRLEDAVRVLTRAITLNPSLPAPWTNLGVALLDQDRYEDAIAAIGRSLRLRPEHGGTLATMGLALERIVWAGGRRDWDRGCALTDRRRSLKLAAFAPLATARPDATFYSLQLGRETPTPPAGMRLVDHTAHLRDFADTAALLTALDLLISVDTSTPHVAASLGRPTWLLSRFDRCWRWRLGERTTPWYDTMRLFAQPAPGDWASPIAAIAQELEGQGPALDPRRP